MLKQTDHVAATIVERLAACLDARADSTLPPLWHWLFFLDPVPANALGPDGHRARGGLVQTDASLPARMWAGGRVGFHRDILIGSTLRRETKLANATERQGRSGKLRFITLQHTIFSGANLLIEEEQDLVYLAPRTPPADAPAKPAPPAPPGASLRTITPDEILLFRFSALTFNAHRIHYDLPYATTVEHYPGLVVHGPLQAMLLANHLGASLDGANIRHFHFRSHKPAFVGQELQLEAWRDAENHAVWHLQTRGRSGAICMTAQATTASLLKDSA